MHKANVHSQDQNSRDEKKGKDEHKGGVKTEDSKG